MAVKVTSKWSNSQCPNSKSLSEVYWLLLPQQLLLLAIRSSGDSARLARRWISFKSWIMITTIRLIDTEYLSPRSASQSHWTKSGPGNTMILSCMTHKNYITIGKKAVSWKWRALAIVIVAPISGSMATLIWSQPPVWVQRSPGLPGRERSRYSVVNGGRRQEWARRTVFCPVDRTGRRQATGRRHSVPGRAGECWPGPRNPLHTFLYH